MKKTTPRPRKTHEEIRNEAWLEALEEYQKSLQPDLERERELARQEFEAAYNLLSKSHSALLLELHDAQDRITQLQDELARHKGWSWSAITYRVKSWFKREETGY
jgi:hypothetical protein